MGTKLTTEELQRFTGQYYSLTENLKAFRKGMRGRKYKENYTLSDRLKHKDQYKFLKFALKMTVKKLLDDDMRDERLLAHATFNRFLSLKYRYKCLKQLLKTVFIYDKMD